MKNSWLTDLSFAQKQRLQFIEAMLIWDGTVKRCDICSVFGVTPNHLTRDIKRYRTHHKNALEYDVEARLYRRGRAFKPLLASGSPEEYLALLQAYCAGRSAVLLPAMGYVAHAESLPSPTGLIDKEVLRTMIGALRNRTGATITYQSLTGSDPVRRTIWPHTLVHTGDRWHVRGFDDRREEFRDFTLTRCSDAISNEAPCPVSSLEDKGWHETEIVEVIPSPRLSGSQCAIIAREFGMTATISGQMVWSCQMRKCLVGYFLDRYRLEYGGSHKPKPTRGQHHYLALKTPEMADHYRFSSG